MRLTTAEVEHQKYRGSTLLVCNVHNVTYYCELLQKRWSSIRLGTPNRQRGLFASKKIF